MWQEVSLNTMNVVPAGFLITLFDSEFSCLYSYCSFMQYNFAWSIFGNMYMMMFFNFEQLADASLYCQNNLILSFLYEVGFIIWITCSSFLKLVSTYFHLTFVLYLLALVCKRRSLSMVMEVLVYICMIHIN